MIQKDHYRLTVIVEILEAVETLEYHDRNFLANPLAVSEMKREFLCEAKGIVARQVIVLREAEK